MSVFLNRATSIVLSSTVRQTPLMSIAKASKSTATAALKYYTANTVIFLNNFYYDFKRKLQGKKPKVKEYPRDTVILYQFPRAYNTPSLSQFALKLESFCRVANIKYQNEFGMTRSSRGLIPFIKLNDFKVEDSEACIEYLSKVFQINLNADLNDEEKAISRLVLKNCEDSFKWPLVLHRFWHSDKGLQETRLPMMAYWVFSYKTYRYGWNSGFARLPKEELYEMGKKDMKAINTLIGVKNYLFSDTQPCEADLAIFATFSQIKYNDQGPLNFYLNTECQNILRLIETFKQSYWKDWDQNTLKSRVKAISK